MRMLDLTGKTFGRWVVKGRAPNIHKATAWYCECVCGNKRAVSSQNLRLGKSVSCGCYRNEVRPTLAKKRDFAGNKNPRARKSIAANGGVWVPSSSVWYKRAAGIYYGAKRNKVPIGFSSAAELATYVRSIAPAACPVFNMEFSERGTGFSKWSPSIDKIDPKLGYVPGNIQVISMLANCMKRDATIEQLRMFAKWVLETT